MVNTICDSDFHTCNFFSEVISQILTIFWKMAIFYSISIYLYPQICIQSLPEHATEAEFIYFLKLFLFLVWTIFKDFIEFVTVLLLFHILVFWP